MPSAGYGSFYAAQGRNIDDTPQFEFPRAPWVNPDLVAGDTPDDAVTVTLLSGPQSFSQRLEIRFNIGDGLPLNIIAVTGIKFEVEAQATVDGVEWISVKALIGGMIGTEHGALDILMDTFKGFKTFGGPNDLWGAIWHRSDLVDLSFGLAISTRLRVGVTEAIASIFRVRATIYYTAPTPSITAAPASLSFIMTKGQSNPLGKPVNITNTGEVNSILDWGHSDDSTWVTVTPDSGTAPSTATISVDGSNLDPGTHNGVAEFTNGLTDPKQVPVELIITEPEESFQAVV